MTEKNFKTKRFWIKTRIFLWFWFFVISIINILLYILYLNFETSFISWIKNNIEKSYESAKTAIDKQQKWFIINIPKQELDKLKNLGFYIYFSKNDKDVKENYKVWYYTYWDDLVFRWDYKDYNILIWKNIADFFEFKTKFLWVIVLADIVSIFVLLMMIYLITNRLLKPLLELSKNISDYDIEKNKELINWNYWKSEIWIINNSINNLISKSKNILEWQKRFIQDSSHELKTPLMQIDTNVEILEEKIDDEKMLQKIENIKKASENINKIISNLSFILREENKTYKLEKINIFAYLTELWNSFIEQAKEKNISIKIIKNFDLILENNTYFLDRLFSNLLQNSIYYNEWNNEIKIEIFEDKIILKDEWIGIKKEEIEKIFDRFYRNSDSNIYYRNWNWLGLTIVKKICDDFWWKININSDLWDGTEFEIFVK